MNWRKVKRIVKYRAKKISRTRYFEGCNGHPCKVTELTVFDRDFFGSEVIGYSLLDGSGVNCSIYHCAPVALTYAQVIDRSKYFQENGMKAYMAKSWWEE